MKTLVQNDFTLIDVSHSVENGMITYKGLPAPIICDYLSREASKEIYQKGTSFQIGTVTLCSNTGTYVDVPFHRYEQGKDLSEIALESLANLDAVVIKILQDTQTIGPEHFSSLDIDNKAVLINTNWSRHWGSDQYFENYPFVTEKAALYLKQQQVKFVGIDSHNIDDASGKCRPCHTILLGADIPICEHMTNLNVLPKTPFKFFAVPVKMKGMGTFPVRAFAIIEH